MFLQVSGVRLLMTNMCENFIQFSLGALIGNTMQTKYSVFLVVFVFVYVTCGPSDSLRKRLSAVVEEADDAGGFNKLNFIQRFLRDFHSHSLL